MRKKTIGVVLANVLVAQLISCTVPRENGSQPRNDAASRDSAGIEIIELPSVANATALTLGPPFLELGGIQSDSNAEFDPRNPFLDVIQLSSGTFVVNDFNRLKWFARDGRFLRTSGRAGSGPGEFAQIRELCRLKGDSILAIDYSSGTLTVWDSSGRHSGTWSRPGFVPFGACTADGTIVVQTSSTEPSRAPTTASYALTKLNGELVQDLGRLPAPTSVAPFLVEPSLVLASGLLIVAPASSYTIEIHRLTGGLVRIIRVLEPARQITRDELYARVSAMFPGSELDPERRKRIDRVLSLPHPASHPAYGRVRIDGLRRIWVSDYEDRRIWTIFSETGHLLGRLTLPGEGAELAGLEDDRIVVRRRDSDGALRLSFHRLPQLAR